MSTLLFLLTSACLAASSGAVAAALRPRGAVAFLLAAYLVAWAEVVVLLALLSPLQLVRRPIVVGSTVALLGVALAVWRAAGRPRPPAVRSRLRAALQDRVLAAFAVVVALGFAYLVALALFTPANSWDAMWVWLARAAFWKQQHAIGYVDDVTVLNAYPPVASIGDLYAMVVASSERFVTLVALGSFAGTAVAVVGIARRLGRDRRSALFAALLFATLPVVVLQASGALVDLPVASFLTAGVYFALGERRSELALAAVAFALAVGAKLTALLAAPVVLVVLVVARGRRVGPALVAGAVGGAIGSAWYVLNLVQTGSPGGGLREHLERQGYLVQTDHGAAATLSRALRLLLNFLDAPGAGGWWAVAYVVAAALAVVLARRGAAGLVALSPLAVLVLGPAGQRAFQWLFFHTGRPDLGLLDNDRKITGASALGSYYGPLGLVLVGSVAAVLVPRVRRRLPPLGVALAAAPLLFLVVVAVAVSYSSFWGRLFVFPVALSAAFVGGLARVRPVAWGLVAVAGATLFLALRANDEKPPEVWGKPRWWVQTRVGPGRDNGERLVMRFADERIPSHAHVGLTIPDRDWSYPFFGAGLDRTVRFVHLPGSVAPDLGWLVVGPKRGAPAGVWRRVFRTADGWEVYRR